MLAQFLKDYDLTFPYHPGKANMIGETLSLRSNRMGSMEYLLTQKIPLVFKVQSLANKFVRLYISTSGCVISFVETRSLLRE